MQGLGFRVVEDTLNPEPCTLAASTPYWPRAAGTVQQAAAPPSPVPCLAVTLDAATQPDTCRAPALQALMLQGVQPPAWWTAHLGGRHSRPCGNTHRRRTLLSVASLVRQGCCRTEAGHVRLTMTCPARSSTSHSQGGDLQTLGLPSFCRLLQPTAGASTMPVTGPHHVQPT